MRSRGEALLVAPVIIRSARRRGGNRPGVWLRRGEGVDAGHPRFRRESQQVLPGPVVEGGGARVARPEAGPYRRVGVRGARCPGGGAQRLDAGAAGWRERARQVARQRSLPDELVYPLVVSARRRRQQERQRQERAQQGGAQLSGVDPEGGLQPAILSPRPRLHRSGDVNMPPGGARAVGRGTDRVAPRAARGARADPRGSRPAIPGARSPGCKRACGPRATWA